MDAKKEAPPGVSTAKLSALLHLTPRRCQQLAEDGVLVRISRGRWNLLESLLGRLRDLERQAAVGGTGQLREYQARLLKARAELAEMDAARVAAETVPLAEVNMTWDAVRSLIRRRLLLVPRKAATRCQRVESIAEKTVVIREILYEALEEIANTPIYDPAEASGVKRAAR